jgi:hypothetical protein
MAGTPSPSTPSPDLCEGIPAGDHHEKSEQDDREREHEPLAREARRSFRHLEHEQERKGCEPQTEHEGEPGVHNLLDVSVDTELHDHPP